MRHIGITGLPLKIFPSILDRVAPGTVETILSFCHYELNDTSLGDMIPYLQSKGVRIINASPTGMGLLTQRGAPAWHPSTPTIRVRAARRRWSTAARRAWTLFSSRCNSPARMSPSRAPWWARRIQITSARTSPTSTSLDRQLLAEVMEILEPIHTSTSPAACRSTAIPFSVIGGTTNGNESYEC